MSVIKRTFLSRPETFLTRKSLGTTGKPKTVEVVLCEWFTGTVGVGVLSPTVAGVGSRKPGSSLLN